MFSMTHTIVGRKYLTWHSWSAICMIFLQLNILHRQSCIMRLSPTKSASLHVWHQSQLLYNNLSRTNAHQPKWRNMSFGMNPFWPAGGKILFTRYFQLRERKKKKVFPHRVDDSVLVWRDSMVEHIKPKSK